MSQDQVMKILKKHPYKKYNAKQLSKLLKIAKSTISTNIKNLYKHNEIKVYNNCFGGLTKLISLK